MRKYNPFNHQTGFTLVEILVSVVVVGLLSALMVGVLFDSYKSSTKSKTIEKIEEEGSVALREIRRSLQAADISTLTCPVGPVYDSISFNSRVDGGDTTISCMGDRIASVSATLGRTIFLTSTDVGVSGGCTDFIKSCDTSLAYPEVEFQFGLMNPNTTGISDRASRWFETKVVVRN